MSPSERGRGGPGGAWDLEIMFCSPGIWGAFHFHALEKEMATHSSVLAWRIPGTAEPGGLPFLGVSGRLSGTVSH